MRVVVRGAFLATLASGLEAIAPAVDAVLAAQVQRLKRFAETGKPTRGAE